MPDIARCRSCGAPVAWVVTERGKRMPVDEQPFAGDKSTASLFYVYEDPADGTLRAVSMRSRNVAVINGTDYDVHQSHYATCPDANTWSGSRR